MKKLLAILSLSAMPFTFFQGAAHAETASEIPRAPFPAVVTMLDFDFDDPKVGCQLGTTTAEDKIRLRWLPSENAVERSSVSNKQVKGRTKVAVTKLAEENGVAVYGYREANVIVLLVPGGEMFATVTAQAERMFMQQNCGLGITLLFTQPLPADVGSGCDSHDAGVHMPGFCGKLAKLDGQLNKDMAFSMSAGLTSEEKVRVLLRMRPIVRP